VGEVALDSITREEATDIYHSLVRSGSGSPHLDFQDVWARFTTDDIGPLLEFTHLVTEGTSLTKKVEGQIVRLQHEALTPAGPTTDHHLKLLALASIANEAECRVSVTALCAAVNVDPLTRPLAALEAEYFLRTTTSGTQTVVAPLHGLRSRAIVTALLHDCPERWIDLAINCLPLILDADIERFLLAAFSRRPQFGDALRSALQDLPLRTWTHAGSISRALLWEGVNRYERENHEALADSVSEHGDGWMLTCDLNLASDRETTDNVRRILADVLKKDEAELPKTHLTDKGHVFDAFREWASRCVPPTSPVTSASDWTGLGDVAFWLGSRHIEGRLADAVRQVVPAALPDDIRISDIAQFISGRHTMGDPGFLSWLESNRETLSSRFVDETASLAVIHADDSVEVLFPVRLIDDGSASTPDGHDFHAEALKRIALLRHLFPSVSTIKSRGVGMEVLSSLIPNDETVRAIPARNLPMSRQVHVNATFRNLVGYKL